MRRPFAVTILAAGVFVACGGDDAQPTESAPSSLVGESATGQFPAIVDVDATFDDGNGTWSFAVTVSSPYDSPARYADGWRVIGDDGTVYGTHTLAHDHAGEQPFTRRQSGVEIPDGVTEVTIEGRDQLNGFGGPSLTIRLEADR